MYFHCALLYCICISRCQLSPEIAGARSVGAQPEVVIVFPKVDAAQMESVIASEHCESKQLFEGTTCATITYTRAG